MGISGEELEFLEQVQADAESIADEIEATTGIDRREFVFRSVVAAAASSFAAGGVTVARAQAAAGGRGGAQQAPPFPLGNGEAPALQFQPYPGGTGALMEKLALERGRAAFERAEFSVEPWQGSVPTSDEDVAYLPAHRLSALIRERRITSARLTDIYLARLRRYDPQLLCAVTIMESQARAEAARADAEIQAGRYRGPLHGLPYGVKDLFSTRGVPTTWGAADFRDRIIDEDAEIVVRLREAGAVLVAKLATGLFAQNDQWFRGRTNNPWNLSQGSSGSSAGPGSATPAGLVAFSIGTETQGSIVSPSIRCGVTALRPTFGRVSRYGGMVLAWSMDRVGPMCRNAEDCAMVFNVLHGVDEKDPSTVMAPFQFNRNISLASLRIGIQDNAPPELVAILRQLGAQPLTIGARPTVPGGGNAINIEGAAAFDEYVVRKAAETGVDLNTPPPTGRGGGGGGGGRGDAPASPMAPADWNPRFVAGRFPRALDFVQMQRRRYELTRRWGEFMRELDMFVSAPQADTVATAQTGHPAVVVPYRFDAPAAGGGGRGGGRGGADPAAPAPALNPQPICGVMIGALFNDDVLLSVAHQMQRVTDFHIRRPQL